MLTKLTRETLAEQAAQILMEFIRSQSLLPGDALPSETKLTADLGVSRPVIREALKSLEGRGVIQIVNGKGAIVRPISSDSLSDFFQRAIHMNRDTIIELMEVRKGIEVQSAVLAAQRRTPEEMVNLERIVNDMRAHLDDAAKMIELDSALHLAIAAATHNVMMYHLVESMRGAIRDFMLTISVRPYDHGDGSPFLDSQALHEAIIDAIKRGDREDTHRLMSAHFDVALVSLIAEKQRESEQVLAPEGVQ